eukprot:5926181-Pleurochrysis_carterae.AAC.1
MAHIDPVQLVQRKEIASNRQHRAADRALAHLDDERRDQGADNLDSFLPGDQAHRRAVRTRTPFDFPQLESGTQANPTSETHRP